MYFRARWVLAAVCFLVCARAPIKEAKVALPSKPLSEQEQVEKLIRQCYRAIEKNEPELLVDLLTADAFAFGLAPSETLSYRDDIVDRIRQELLPLGLKGEEIRVNDKQLLVGMAVGERSAWISDLPRVAIARKKTVDIYYPRLTAHAVREEKGWRLDAIALSFGVTDEELYAPDAAKKFLAPAEVSNERGKDSDQMVGTTKRILEDLSLKVDRVSAREEVMLLGTDPSEVYQGGAAFKALVKPRLQEIKRSVFSYKIDGNIKARVASDGKTGFVAANVILRLGAGKKMQTLPGFRTLWVYEQAGDLWTIVQEHQSLALSPEQRKPASEETQTARAKADKAFAAKKGDEKSELMRELGSSDAGKAAGRPNEKTNADGGVPIGAW